MRVLYNATFARVGGGLSYVVSQVRALAEQDDLELTVCSGPFNHQVLRDLCADLGARCDFIRVPSVPVRWAWEQAVLPVRARRYDVLVCPGNFVPLLARTPTLLVLQTAALVGEGRRYGAGLGKSVKSALCHLSLRRADTVVTISEPLAEVVRRERWLRGVDPIAVPSGAPPVRHRTLDEAEIDARRAREIVGPHPFLLSVAHDYPHKRLDDLGRLASRLGPVGGSATLDLVADSPEQVMGDLRILVVGEVGEERRRLITELAGAGADRLVWVGGVSDSDVVRSLYAEARVAITTSALEAWNLSIHEATSQGTPMVATDLPAHRELAGEGVELYPVGDVDAMVDAMAKALGRTDRTPWVPEWTWSCHGAALADHIRRLAGRRSR